MIIAYAISGILLSILAVFFGLGELGEDGEVNYAGLIIPVWLLVGGILILCGVK